MPTPKSNDGEVILVCYGGPSGALVVDDVPYPIGQVLPMSRCRYLEVLANEALRSEGHSLATVADGGLVEPSLTKSGDGSREFAIPAPPEAVPPESEPKPAAE
jgi:hypothetical protein